MDNIGFLVQLKRLLKNLKQDLAGLECYKDMIYNQETKNENNEKLFNYVMQLIKFYVREEGDLDFIGKHLEKNTTLIDAKLKSLYQLGKSSSDDYEFRKQVIINGIMLDRLVDLNNGLGSWLSANATPGLIQN